MTELALSLRGVRATGAREFHASARDVLGYLHARMPLAAWVVVLADADQWVVAELEDTVYGLAPGHHLPWASTLCSRMVAGLGPRVAPRVADVDVYAQAPQTKLLTIGAYAGVPLARQNRLLGTICAFDPEPRADVIIDMQLLDLFAGMLSSVLDHELRTGESARRAARAEADATIDPLTKLGTRLAWNRVLAEEEARCRRTGRPATVITVDLDGLKRINDAHGHDAGDRLLQRAAIALRRATRLCDHVVRLGGDEFAVLAVEAEGASAETLLKRISSALGDAGVEASLGLAVRSPSGGIEAAWHAADAAMYADKRSRRHERLSRALAGDDGTFEDLPVEATVA